MTERYVGRYIGIKNQYPVYGIQRGVSEPCCGKGFEGDPCCQPPFENCRCGGKCGSCSGGGEGSPGQDRCIAHCYDFMTCTETHALVPGMCNSGTYSETTVLVTVKGCGQGDWSGFSFHLTPEQYRSGAYVDHLRQYASCANSVCFFAKEHLGQPPISPFDVIPCRGGGSGQQPIPGIPGPGGSMPAVPPGESCLQYWERICAEAHGAGTPGYIDCVNRAVGVCRKRPTISAPGQFRPTGFVTPFEDVFVDDGLSVEAVLAAEAVVGGTTEPRNTVTVTLTANVNDYNPGPCRILAAQTDGSGNKTITGISIGQQDGQWLIIENFSTVDNIILSVESSSSAAENRFNNGTGLTPITILPGGVERFIYTSRINRWRRV